MFGQKLLKRKAKEKSRCVELAINSEQFKDHIAAFLHASRIINDNDEVTDIEFDASGKSTTNLKLYLKGSV